MKRPLAPVLALALGLVAGALLVPRSERTIRETATIVHPSTVRAHGPVRGKPLARSATVVEDGVLQNLVPSDADVLSSRAIPAAGGVPRQVAVTWGRRYGPSAPSYVDFGFNLYEAGPPRGPRYRRVFALGDPPRTTYRAVSEIRSQLADLSGDGHPDLLLYEDLGGSAGNGLYHLVATIDGRTRELDRRRLSMDDGAIELVTGALLIYEGLVRKPGDHGPHCCWSVWRRTVKTWNGRALVTSATSRQGPPRRIPWPAR